MKYFVTTVAAIALASGAIAQEKTKGGVEALRGTWVASSINGQMLDGAPELTLTFAGDKYHQTVGGEVNERGSFKIDPSKKPMTIDLAITEGADAGKAQLGVFEIVGDTLRLGLDVPGAGKRPDDLIVKDGTILFVGRKKTP